MNTDRKIDSLKPGYSVQVSSCGNVSVEAERSGDGKTLRFVRITKTDRGVRYETFRTCRF